MNDIHSYVGAYVTNALDEELRIVFAEHLPECDSCSREVQEFNETLALLSALPATQPPPSLRAKVLDSISRVRIDPPDDGEDLARHGPATPPASLRNTVLAAVADNPSDLDDDDHERVSSTAPVTPSSRVPGRKRTGRWQSLAVAASLILAATFGGWAVIQQQRIDAMERAQQAAQPEAELLRAADLKTYPFTWPDGSDGAYLVSRQQGRGMITGAVPAVDQGRTYQLWSMRYENAKLEPEPGPTFRAGETEVWENDFDDVQQIAISLEQDGGSQIPTKVLFTIDI